MLFMPISWLVAYSQPDVATASLLYTAIHLLQVRHGVCLLLGVAFGLWQSGLGPADRVLRAVLWLHEFCHKL